MGISSTARGRHHLPKAEHLYSALHDIQTTLKRSGMDHNLGKSVLCTLYSVMYFRNLLVVITN